MAFIYCDECEAGMDRPSQREVITNQYICPNCGSNQSHRIDEDTKSEYIDRLLTRIEIIEDKLSIISDKY